MPNDYQYEVFKGSPDDKTIRLGAVKDCERAKQLMYRMYARLPGDYFILSTSTREVVCSVKSSADKSCGPTHFDIFCGLPDKNANWVDTVEGLAAARHRMEEIARTNPGRYFLFSRIDHSILGFAEGNTAGKAAGQSKSGTAA